MSGEKTLKCTDPECGHEFGICEAELHDASMTHITIGCPKCSNGIDYLRAHMGDDEDEY